MASVQTNFAQGYAGEDKGLVNSAAIASADIRPGRFLKATSTGIVAKVAEATTGLDGVVGASGDTPIKSGARCVYNVGGKARLLSAGKVVASDRLASDATGRAGAVASAGNAGTTLVSGATGAAFTNQPSSDGIEIVSSNAGDTTQTITIYGTTNATETVVSETKTLNGTTPVSTTKTDWGEVLAIVLSAATLGNVTVREASADQTIKQLTAGTLSAGYIATTAPWAFFAAPTVEASGASTKKVGLLGVNVSGSTVLVGDTLSGTSPQTTATALASVTAVLVGDVEASRTVTVKSGAAVNGATVNAKATAVTPAAGPNEFIDAILTL